MQQQSNFIAKNFRETFPVDTMGKSPLCMAQYLKLLCSCRIPQPIRDEVFVAPKGTAKHVLVAHKNQVITFSVENTKCSVLIRALLHDK